MKPSRKTKWILPSVIVIALLMCAAIVFLCLSRAPKAKTHKLLQTSEYNCVFLSMFPIETYSEEDFSYFRALDVLKLTEVIPNAKVMKSYLADVRQSENELTSIYLGVDPKKVTAAEILEWKSAFPEASFEVFPAYIRLSDWTKSLSLEKTYNAYLSLAEGLVEKEGIHVYSFFAQEWLIADDANYESKKGILLAKDVATRLFIYGDVDHNCDLKPESMALYFDEFNRLVTNAKSNGYRFPDLSSYDIIFLGDSIIGRFTGHSSIPELVASLTNARTYNFGYGGSSAAGNLPNSGPNLLAAYLTGQIADLPAEVPIHDGIIKRLSDEASPSDQTTVFVLHFGLNDYFQAYAIDNPSDPKDSSTFCGALRGMIETLKKERPNAKLVLIAPNGITSYHAGADIKGAGGAPLADYVDAIVRLGEEYQIPVINDFVDVIPSSVAKYYLEDDIHPNENGRYRISKAVISCIEHSIR